MSVKEILEEYTCELEGDHYSPEEVDKVVKAIQSLLDQKLNKQLDEIIDMVEEAKRLLPNNPQYSESELEYGKDLGRIEMNDQFFTKLKAMKEEK